MKISFKSLWFLSGLMLAAGTATFLDGATFRLADPMAGYVDLEAPQYPLADKRPLTQRELHHAQVAWDFIEAQTQPETGFVNSVAWFPSTTLWDQGSYIFALVSALKFGIIDQHEFQNRTSKFLDSLSRIELTDAALPNKVYNTKTLAMTDYSDQLVPEGIGWSALDIARMLLALRVLERQSPEFGARIRQAVAGWDLSGIAHNGELTGASRLKDGLRVLQEGRIGYEQYGARAAAMWGLDVSQAMSARRILDWRTIEGVNVPTDTRTAARYQTINPTSSEPYILMGIEMGFDAETLALAGQVLAVQEARFENENKMTIVSEDHLDNAPYFAYASVFSNRRAWAVVDSNGANYPDMRSQSTKASFAWDVLFDTDYTNLAVSRVESLAVVGQGWYAGIYEATGGRNTSLALNTNAVILTALHYRSFGPMWSAKGLQGR